MTYVTGQPIIFVGCGQVRSLVSLIFGCRCARLLTFFHFHLLRLTPTYANCVCPTSFKPSSMTDLPISLRVTILYTSPSLSSQRICPSLFHHPIILRLQYLSLLYKYHHQLFYSGEKVAEVGSSFDVVISFRSPAVMDSRACVRRKT